jgi:FAD:protein FMN transferase
MKEQRILMGMPVTIEIAGAGVHRSRFDALFAYFERAEKVFSPFLPTSETSLMNQGLLRVEDASDEMQTIVRLAEKTRVATDGYFDVHREGVFNPVGIVKGWAIYNAAEMLRRDGIWDFYVDAGGDVQLSGRNDDGEYWTVGIRNPFDIHQVVKVLKLSDIGIATSGNYIRGDHIYDPHGSDRGAARGFAGEIVSLTVLGPNVYEADRYATAAFAMGPAGIEFIEREPCLEGYMISRDGIATMTSGFADYVA